MILITGATGNVDGELVRALAGAGEDVRGLVRDTSTKLSGDVEPVAGDLNRPESLSAALEGVRRVFLLSGYEDMPGLAAVLGRDLRFEGQSDAEARAEMSAMTGGTCGWLDPAHRGDCQRGLRHPVAQGG